MMLAEDSLCLCVFRYVGEFFNAKKLSSTSQIGHQHVRVVLYKNCLQDSLLSSLLFNHNDIFE